MKRETVLHRYPVVSYFILVFLISWGSSLLLGGPKYLRGEPLDINDALIMAPLMILAPTIVGVALTALLDGKAGLRDLWARVRKWRVGGRWYAVALIFPALILILAYLLAALIAPELTPNFLTFGILSGLFAGFFEEVGWMGFAYPRMQAKRTALSASLILGFIHALWHVLADFLGNSAAFGSSWLPYMAGFFVFVWALRVLIVWVYENTESVFLTQVIHASSTGFLAILIPIGIPGWNWAVFYPIYAVALWIVAALVIARYGKTLTGQPEQIPATA